MSDPTTPLVLMIYHPDGSPFCAQSYRVGQEPALAEAINGKLWATLAKITDARAATSVDPTTHVNGSTAPLGPAPNLNL